MKTNYLQLLITKVTKFCAAKPIIASAIFAATITGGITTGIFVCNMNTAASMADEITAQDDITASSSDAVESEVLEDETIETEASEENPVETAETVSEPASSSEASSMAADSSTSSASTKNQSANAGTSYSGSSGSAAAGGSTSTSNSNNGSSVSTPDTSVNNTPSGISPINEAFKQRYLGIVGCMYNGGKKAQFDNMINQVAAGQRSANDVINEIKSIGSFTDTDGSQRVVSYADIKTFTSKSNDVNSMIIECNNNGTLWGSTYTGVAVYWNQSTQTNTIYVLRVTLGTEIINWN